MTSAVVLIVAALLDYLIGDPWGWPHPVQFMGWAISHITKLSLKYCHNSLTQRIAGILLGIILVIGSGLAGWLIIQTARWLHPLLAIGLESILLASCFAGKSLRTAAVTVLKPLTAGNLTEARDTLSNYVGRDTKNLSEAEILRAKT